MLILLSPSKKLSEKFVENKINSTPKFLNKSLELVGILKKMDQSDIAKLMNLSDKIAQLNFERYQGFSSEFNKENSYHAAFLFKGNVYDGLDIESLNESEILRANDNLRILSGLYGILHPLDLIQPYRLEMGTSLASNNGSNLYKFWGNEIANFLNNEESNLIINLASNEYYKAVNEKILKANVITPTFKEKKSSGYKMIMPYVKKARGLMARYIIQNNIKNAEDIKSFNTENYQFNPSLSEENNWVFTRD